MKNYLKTGLAAGLLAASHFTQVPESIGSIKSRPEYFENTPGEGCLAPYHWLTDYPAGKDIAEIIYCFEKNPQGDLKLVRILKETETIGVYDAFTYDEASCLKCHKNRERIKVPPRMYKMPIMPEK